MASRTLRLQLPSTIYDEEIPNTEVTVAVEEECLTYDDEDTLRGRLPPETVMGVLSFLTPKELAIVARLNSDYFILAQDDQLWKPLCLRWGVVNESSYGWKEVFKRTIDEQKKAEQQAARRCWQRTRYQRNSYGKFKTGDYAVLKSRPCKIDQIHVSRPGKHGNAKIFIKGIELFTQTPLEEIFHYGHEAVRPTVTKTYYSVTGIDLNQEGFAELLDADGKERTLRIPDNDKGTQMRDLWHDGLNEVYISVLDVTWRVGEVGEEEEAEHHEEGILDVCKGAMPSQQN